MEKTLDFKVIFYLIRKNIIWVILAAVIGGLVAFLYTDNMVPKKYTSSAQVYISNTQDIGEISMQNLNASRSFADTYRIILQSEKATSLLREMLRDNEEYQKCNYKNSYSVGISVRDESEVLRFTVTSRDPELSKVVCNTMIEVSKVLISDIFDAAGTAYSLGDAYANYNPTSPNIQTNTFVGVIISVAIVCVIVVMWALLDNRVKDEADFVAKVNVPVLGEVPSINEESEKKEGYYYYAYTKKEDK
ncbi:MAG: hypothetical protein IJN48_01435 [Clostridia bacterium]|nr:hypothetical protein [Clostridia bacterium]